jgi:GNAT superfamily N-acetyltransferase
VTLDDGLKVPTRRIAPGDAAALQRFHLGLSDYSIYLRHIHALPRLSDTQLKYFTDLDGIQRFAIIALDPGNPTEIIAVVRYEGAAGSDRAEYAALVTDAWQGKGLGTALTRDLIAAARRRGIRSLYATVLPENIRMLSLLRDLGLPESKRFVDGVAEIEVDLSEVRVDPAPAI